MEAVQVQVEAAAVALGLAGEAEEGVAGPLLQLGLVLLTQPPPQVNEPHDYLEAERGRPLIESCCFHEFASMMLVLVTLLPLQVFCINKLFVTNQILLVFKYLQHKKHLLRELQNTKCAVL